MVRYFCCVVCVLVCSLCQWQCMVSQRYFSVWVGGLLGIVIVEWVVVSVCGWSTDGVRSVSDCFSCVSGWFCFTDQWLCHDGISNVVCTVIVSETGLNRVWAVSVTVSTWLVPAMVIIIIAFTGTVRDFLQSPRCATDYLQHLRSSAPGTIVCKSRATRQVLVTCNVMLHPSWYEGTVQLLSLTELKSHLFELYFFDWTINRLRRGGNRSTRRKLLAMTFRKCHILKPEDSSPKRDLNPHNSIGGRLGKLTC